MQRFVYWHKSEDGFVDSKCARFSIEPNSCGRTQPIDYVLRDRKRREAHPCDTQREAKERAETIVRAEDQRATEILRNASR